MKREKYLEERNKRREERKRLLEERKRRSEAIRRRSLLAPPELPRAYTVPTNDREVTQREALDWIFDRLDSIEVLLAEAQAMPASEAKNLRENPTKYSARLNAWREASAKSIAEMFWPEHIESFEFLDEICPISPFGQEASIERYQDDLQFRIQCEKAWLLRRKAILEITPGEVLWRHAFPPRLSFVDGGVPDKAIGPRVVFDQLIGIPNGREVIVGEETYSLEPLQMAVIQVLYIQRKRSDEGLHWDTILKEMKKNGAETSEDQPSRIFKRNRKAYKALVQRTKKRHYRLLPRAR